MATASAGIRTKCRVRLGDAEQKRVTSALCLQAGMTKRERLGVVEFWDHNTLDGNPLFVCSIVQLDGKNYAFRYNPEFWGGF